VEELLKKLEELGRAHEEFKKANDERIAQLEKKGSADPLVSVKVDKANSDLSRLENEIKELKTAMARSSMGAPETEKSEDAEKKLRKDAFLGFVRKGAERLSGDLVKGLQASSDPDGGYLVANEIEAEIIRNLPTMSVMRMLASVRSLTTGDSLQKRRRTSGVTASWVGEMGTSPADQNPKLGMLNIPAHQMQVVLSETAQILEDASINIEQWLGEEGGEAFGNLEGAAFVSGNGVAKPRGILTYAAGTGDGQIQQVVSGTAATIADADGGVNGLIAMTYALKAAYAKNGKFILNRLTTGSVRKLKDANKQYIWQPGLGGSPATILGYAYEEDDNMPVEGANNLVVAFGDFKKAYKIVDRLGMSAIRDPYTSKPDVEFLFRRRVGGAVEIFEALKLLKCSA